MGSLKSICEVWSVDENAWKMLGHPHRECGDRAMLRGTYLPKYLFDVNPTNLEAT